MAYSCKISCYRNSLCRSLLFNTFAVVFCFKYLGNFNVIIMSSLETYVTRIKPAIDDFLKMPEKSTLAKVEKEVKEFNFGQMRIFQVQIVVPLVIKLDQLSG